MGKVIETGIVERGFKVGNIVKVTTGFFEGKIGIITKVDNIDKSVLVTLNVEGSSQWLFNNQLEFFPTIKCKCSKGDNAGQKKAFKRMTELIENVSNCPHCPTCRDAAKVCLEINKQSRGTI